MTGYVALVVRASEDKSKRGVSVEDQERWGRDYAARVWPDLPVRVYSDNASHAAVGADRSGTDFEQFRQDILAGLVAQVWTNEQSRLTRTEGGRDGWFDLAGDLHAAGVTHIHTNDKGVVEVLGELAGISTVLAAAEVRKLRKRVCDRLAENRKKGIPNGGSFYGYRHTVDEIGVKTLAIVDEQADAIRWVAEKILAGWSLTNLAAELRGRGLVGSHGGTIDVSAVRRMVTNPVISGLRTHKGKVVGAGNWQIILADDVRLKVVRKLDQDRIVRRVDGGTYPIGAAHKGHAAGRRYLLTGLANCGVCGKPLAGTLKQRRKGVEGQPYLLCTPRRGGKGCVGVKQVEVEPYVVNTLLGELAKPQYGFLAAIVEDGHSERRDQIVAELEAVERKRDELAGLWSADVLSTSALRTATAGLDKREQELRAELAEVPQPVSNVDVATIRANWPGMELDEQRTVLSLFVSSVTINRVKSDRPRVDIRWHGQPECPSDCEVAA